MITTITNFAKAHWRIPAFALLLISPLLFYAFKFREQFVLPDHTAWGTFGDFTAGTVGTLLTLIAFIYVYKSYQAQVENFYTAGFENTLFKMIEFHHRLIEHLQSGEPKSLYRGRIALNQMYADCDHELSQLLGPGLYRGVSDAQLKKDVIAQYEKAYTGSLHQMGHYFRHLYHIFWFIDTSKLPEDEKLKYAKILRSQLSSAEIVLIGLNGLTVYGENFHPLVIRFSLLHRLMHENYYRGAFVRLYPQEAFGKEDISQSMPPDPGETKQYYGRADGA